MFSNVKKILVLKLRHIGDVLLTVPVARALRDSFPGAQVSVLVNSGTEEMLTLNPLIKEVLVRKNLKDLPAFGKMREEAAFVKTLRARGFDMTVDLTGGDRPALLSYLSGAKIRIGYRPKRGLAWKRFIYTHMAERPKKRTHTVLRDLNMVRQFEIDTRDLTVDIYSSAEDELKARALLRENGLVKGSFVHIHPASRWVYKCWTDEGMAYVADRLHEKGLKSVFTASAASNEKEKVRSILSLVKKAKPVDLSGRLGLKHLPIVSREAAFFLGVDTAPMHIAAAAGAKVIAIFGPSGAFDWGPWENEAARTFTPGPYADSPYPAKNGVQRFGKNVIIQADWECVQCGKESCPGRDAVDCLDKLEPEAVWEIIRASAGL